MTATNQRRVSRVVLLTILAFEAGVLTLEQACAALDMSPRELIETESRLVGEGRDLARERGA